LELTNNAPLNPDYPCGWTSFVAQQTYHLDIALESNGPEPGSNGYSYSSMVQIWAAANATKSNVMMQWWRPDALFDEYLGTDAEFIGVHLPATTQDCKEHRVDPLDRCSPDWATRVGDPRGSCGESPYPLAKLVGTAIKELSENPAVPPALHSPAYRTIQKFQISDLQMGDIFRAWFALGGRDRYHLDPREAVCDWVVEHLEELVEFVPASHPRVVQENPHHFRGNFLAALVLSCLAIVGTFITAQLTYIRRAEKVMRLAQPRFLGMLLVGMLLVSLGALLNAIEPSDAICVSVVWLVNLGYTLELVPLIVKVAAINRLLTLTTHTRAGRSGRRMHQVNEKRLNGAVLLIAIVVSIGLMLWTFVDPPSKNFEVVVTDDLIVETGEFIVERTNFCKSEGVFWNYVAVSWQLLLLLAASVLAFQSRKISQLVEDVNETRTLAMMIYSHFLFISLRLVSFLYESRSSFSFAEDEVASDVSRSQFAAARSIIFAADTIATLSIYFAPKFFKKGSSINSDEIDSSSNFMNTPDVEGNLPERQLPVKKSVHKSWNERTPDSVEEKDLMREALKAARQVRGRFSQENSHLSEDDSSSSAAMGFASGGVENRSRELLHGFIRDSLNLGGRMSSSESESRQSRRRRSSGGISSVGSHSSGRMTSMQYSSHATSLAPVSEVEGTVPTDSEAEETDPTDDGTPMRDDARRKNEEGRRKLLEPDSP